MKILLTGATGYIGQRLLPVLLKKGFQVVCCVREKSRFQPPVGFQDQIEILVIDFLNPEAGESIPKDIDGAYFLIHSMSNSEDYDQLELKTAIHFREAISETNAKHVIYLSGISNSSELSKHLSSRKSVEVELSKGSYNFTTLRAGIIIGSGSASFEIIRDLVEKLPVMVAPKWLNTKCQPIAIRDVIYLLENCLFLESAYNRNFDIGGDEVLSYKEMLLGYSNVRELGRKIWIVPVMSPKISSYWLYFITSTSFKLASALVGSMKVEVVCQNRDIHEIIDWSPINYEDSIRRTVAKIEKNEIISSWTDPLISSNFDHALSEFIQVPSFGCLKDHRSMEVQNSERSLDKIWKIGGQTGWYYATGLWKFRGFLDKCAGGVGLRRGRTHTDKIDTGDVIDFWRVIYANKKEGRLLLFAEMKLPGEAWLEFKLENNVLHQKATFRPKGLLGRLYWFSVLPLHGIIFKGMLKQLTK
jgi:uncharacterized protein YbjT (DUF2867 family)